MRNALDIFYIMLMLNLPSSEPSGALVKNQSSEPAYPNERKQKKNEKLAETADK